MCTHIRGVSYLLPSETDDIDKSSARGFITRLYSATVPTDSIHGKKIC